MNKKRSKFNQFAISLIMGVIIIAFVFTGVQSFTNDPNNLGAVDDTHITVPEYNRALSRTLDYWTKINQGKSLTQKEIRDRGIKEQVFEQLVSQKMMLNFAKSMKFDAGTGAVKNAIISQYDEFKTNGQFDVTKYKRILSLNSIPFKKFEEDVIDQVKMNKLADIIESQQNSDNLIQDMLRFKNFTSDVKAISFSKESMTENLAVSKSEIDAFLKESKAKAIIETLYETYKATNPKKLLTLEQKKPDLAKSHIQKTKRKELKTFNEKLKTDLQAAFEANSWAKVKKLAKKYNLNFQDKASISLLNLSIPGMSFEQAEMAALLTSKNTKQVLVDDSPLTIALMKSVAFKNEKMKDKEKEQFLSFSKNSYSRSLNFKILELQKKNSQVTRPRSL